MTNYTYYENNEQNEIINEINYSKSLYKAQTDKVKQEVYMKDLLYQDFINKVKSNRSAYDVIKDIIEKAKLEVAATSKKDRKNIDLIESRIREDFLNNDKSFKIVGIISGGYESYYWKFDFKWHDEIISIVIPNLSSLNKSNFEYAYEGKYAFSIKTNEYTSKLVCSSWTIKDIANAVKEYIDNKVSS